MSETSLIADLREWLLPMLKERCRHSENWHVKQWWRRWAYTAKALICVIARRENDSDEGIEVAHTNGQTTYSPEWGTGGAVDFLQVGPGWRDWWVRFGTAMWP